MRPLGLVQKFMAVAAIAAGLGLPVSPLVANANETPAAPSYTAPDIFPAGHALAPQSLEDVDVRLVLVFDSSSSMKDEEYAIQFEVARAALTSDDVLDAWFGAERNAGAIDSIAISVVDFAGNATLRVPWVDFRRDDPNLEARFAAYGEELARVARERNSRRSDGTHLGTMLQFVQHVFGVAPWRAEVRDVVDVFGDGKNNGGLPVHIPRQELANMGVTINALAIVNEEPTLADIYRTELVTQPTDAGGRFILPGRVWAVARNMQAEGNNSAFLTSFNREATIAFRRKIVWETALLEITPLMAIACVPEETFPPYLTHANFSLR